MLQEGNEGTKTERGNGQLILYLQEKKQRQNQKSQVG